MKAASSRSFLERLFLLLSVVYSVVLLLGAFHLGFRLPTTPLEVFIFITGAASVWLAVKEHLLNWPVGIVNVVLWTVLFLQQKLYANAALQVVYVVSGFIGWYWWLHGSAEKSAIPVRAASLRITLITGAVVLLLSYPVMRFLVSVGGASTYWDGLTTLLSLAGQYFLMRKWLENWHFWIIADIIYVGLFFSQKLYLGAQLYVILLMMCVFGIAAWMRALLATDQTCTTPL